MNKSIPSVKRGVWLAQESSAAALALLAPLRQRMAANGWGDLLLKVLVRQAAAYQTTKATDKALQRLSEALTLAEPGGYIRLFIDEGDPMKQLLAVAQTKGLMPNYISKLLDAFARESQTATSSPTQPLVEPLSDREREILQLIAQGLSNREISERLFLALSTVKGHNQNIFGKLQVKRRTEAVARAQELGLV